MAGEPPNYTRRDDRGPSGSCTAGAPLTLVPWIVAYTNVVRGAAARARAARVPKLIVSAWTGWLLPRPLDGLVPMVSLGVTGSFLRENQRHSVRTPRMGRGQRLKTLNLFTIF